MRVLLLENARSGSPSRRRRMGEVEARLSAEGARVEVESPASADAMRERASRAHRAEQDVVVVSGGDGTLHAAVNGLVRVARAERPPLAVIPSGRGNDFAS